MKKILKKNLVVIGMTLLMTTNVFASTLTVTQEEIKLTNDITLIDSEGNMLMIGQYLGSKF